MDITMTKILRPVLAGQIDQCVFDILMFIELTFLYEIIFSSLI